MGRLAVALAAFAVLAVPAAGAAPDLPPIVFQSALACPDSNGCPFGPKYNDRIYAITRIGSPAHALTNGTAADQAPIVSPNYMLIGFIREAPGVDQIWVMGIDGSRSRMLAHTTPTPALSWAPGSKRVSYDGDSPDGKAIDLYAVGTDGSARIRLTSNADGVFTNASEWSPDGKRVAYEWDNENASTDGISVVFASGGAPTQLCTSCDTPRWSPDGKRILYQSEKSGDVIPLGVHSVAPDGTHDVELASGKSGDATWSADGTRISFFRITDVTTAEGHCWTMKADGTGQKQLSRIVQSAAPSAWSPDGKKLAFLAEGGNTFAAYVDDADGTHQVLLTRHAGSEVVWSPDGTRILFLREDGTGGEQVAVINPDGSGIKQLTKHDDRLSLDWPQW